MEKLNQTCIRISEDTMLEVRSRKINLSLLVRDLLNAYLRVENRDLDNLRKDAKAIEEEERAVGAKLAAVKAKIRKTEELEEKRRRKELIEGAPWREPI